MLGLRRNRSRRGSGDDGAFGLDTPLLQISKKDAWTIGDACVGTQIFGATGSGKTSGSGQAIATAMLARGFGGLVLTAKPDELSLWRSYAVATGRESSLIVFNEHNDLRYNFLENARHRSPAAGLTENVVSMFDTVLKATNRGDGQSTDPFWSNALTTLLRNAVDLILLAGAPLTLPEIAAVISSAPKHRDDLGSPQWQGHSRCWRLLRDAEARSGTDGHDLEVTARYWCQEFPDLADATRTSIVATFSTKADGLLRGAMRQLFCTDLNITPEITHKGAVLIIDLPTKRHREFGRLAQILWKYCWQRATEDRDINANPRPVFLWADEAQEFVTDLDAEFQATARSARACTVYLTQNIPSYHRAFGANGKAAADNLLGNLQTKIFHANGDPETIGWAEKIVAQDWKTQVSVGSQDGRASSGADGQGQGSVGNTTTSKSLAPTLLAKRFTELRTGGLRHDLMVDGVIVQPGRSWEVSGKNYVEVAFDQRGTG